MRSFRGPQSGINRWAFKRAIGYSRRWGHWLLNGYAGVCVYTTNNTAGGESNSASSNLTARTRCTYRHHAMAAFAR